MRFSALRCLGFAFAISFAHSSFAAESPESIRELQVQKRAEELARQAGVAPDSKDFWRYRDRADQTLPDVESGQACGLEDRIRGIHKAALYAADSSYDVQKDGALEGGPVGYKLVETFMDDTGFKGTSFESQDGSRRRIFGVAGSEVIATVDLRDWLSGMGMGLKQCIGTAAQQMVREAVDYAWAQGDVVVTGQSQGGIIAQVLGYWIQLNLDVLQEKTGRSPAGSVRVVTWGITGGREVISRILQAYGGGNLASMQYREEVAKKLQTVGYFFSWDYFARIGTFIGETRAFPDEDAFTDGEKLYLPLPYLGTKLEGHFLTAYKRASRKGGLCNTHSQGPAARWTWLTRQTEWLQHWDRINEWKELKLARQTIEQKQAQARERIQKECRGDRDEACIAKVWSEISDYEFELPKVSFKPIFVD